MQVKQYGSLIYIKCKHIKSFYTFMYMLIYKNKEFSSDFQVIFFCSYFPGFTTAKILQFCIYYNYCKLMNVEAPLNRDMLFAVMLIVSKIKALYIARFHIRTQRAI